MNVKGKTVLVSGSNRGLGKAFVLALLQAGAVKVYAAARDLKELNIPGAHPVELDITDPVSVAKAAQICADIDLLVNNAGYLKYGPLLAEDSVESLRHHFEVNTIGTLLMSRAFAPVLAKRGGGAMINILSVLSWLNIPESGPYSASKSAQWSLTNGLRNELREQNTFVMGVHPGYIDTDMAAGVEASKTSPETVVRMTLEALGESKEELIIDDAGRWVKSTLSSADAGYLSPVPS
ncbi:SDR family oxidoreductase [Pseudomonas sp. NA-150]|uniref:SDR family oxidoreductase n=1 Tax=Pseudomonas sp. NA-150 TaxID=3367525 RepID=UPI0037CB82B6